MDTGGGTGATSDPLHAERYRIAASRDARFDGQFVTAVHSTRIYCRPSCPARTPRSSGVTFYPTSAAAHLAGYRACKRCLPEASPGSPAWNVREDVAARAMRLVTDGVVERDGVPALAARLGYSPRHLTRILVQELGAGPKALSRAQRAQHARTLLTTSSLPVADVAFAAGFGSVRQFNDTVREVYGLTPTALRARSGRAAPTPDGALRVHLPARPPFDAHGLFAWFAARALPGVEVAATAADPGGARYERVVRLPGGPAWFAATPADPGPSGRGTGIDLEVRMTTLSDLPTLVARVRSLFDLDADPVAVDALLGVVPELAPSVAAVPGIRVPGALDADELVVRAVLGQQVRVAAARTALGRVVDALGEPVPDTVAPGMRMFPTAAVLADAVGRQLVADAGAGSAPPGDAERVIRGPRARVATLHRVAAGLADGSLVVDRAATLDDLRARLLAVPGVGPWTAAYVALRVRHHPDLLLPKDVAVRNGAQALGIPDDPRGLSVWSSALAPWRSYLTMHLWRAAARTPPHQGHRPNGRHIP
ncbi:DNA-3-methyladenine glycosylase [Curtobacterium sp. MCBD17_034]|uniref:AlkA N-terminal domain-containing protein n=1 Tax=unclassified Curtobacterium TaxID=257496 RepID=UPI000DA7265A|nr:MULTISPECIES: AlkA N-terminal domain-containing protein [unclassified Curtobacterium]PZF62200.1 DNA-3-methyladenine glycosylase [Curtobacterium sp. MCBD17_034]PZM33013.1 DNA-3-methyladenine glycosylase [Curtobacterium sp. MCBD17_031]